MVPAVTNPLHVELGTLSAETKDTEKAPSQVRSTFMPPGLIKETQLCDFAYQIADGLAHLANMNVRELKIAHRQSHLYTCEYACYVYVLTA